MLVTPFVTHVTRTSKEPPFSKTRGMFPTFDLLTTSETSTAPCQFQLLRCVQGVHYLPILPLDSSGCVFVYFIGNIKSNIRKMDTMPTS